MLSEFREIINDVYNDDTGGLDVNIQHQTAPLFKYDLIREDKADITLTAPVAIDDDVINVSVGHGFTAASGETIVLFENDRYLQARVKSVATNAITIYFPVASAFTVAGAFVMRGNVFMNVDGSGTSQKFCCQLRNFTTPIDIETVIITMTHPLAGDDGKFGGIAALTNGLLFRKENSTKFNLGNIQKNSDFKLTGGIVDYPAAAPAGSYGTDITYDLIVKFQNVLRLNPSNNDTLEAFVRDDLTGLDLLEISLLGHYTIGES